MIETKVEAEREILALQSALKDFDALLSEDAKQSLAHTMQDLQVALDTNDLTLIDAKKLALKPHSDAFAALIMNQSVKTSMAGTSAKDW